MNIFNSVTENFDWQLGPTVFRGKFCQIPWLTAAANFRVHCADYMAQLYNFKQ